MNDYEIFEAIIDDKLTDELKERYKNNNGLKCYTYFSKQKPSLKEVNLDNLLNKLYFVGIDLGSDEDEQQIFDTTNSLGVSLTTAELLKNRIYVEHSYNLLKRTYKRIDKFYERNIDNYLGFIKLANSIMIINFLLNNL